MDYEIARIALVLGVLAADSYADIRRRSLLGRDCHYAAVGAAGLALTLLSGPTTMDILGMVSGITLTLVIYRLRAMGSGDCVVMLVFSVSLPAALGIPFLPALVLLGGITLVGCAIITYNAALNVSHHMSPPAAPPPPVRAHLLKRAAAFAMAHRMRAWERHVVPIEKQGGGFSLFGGSPQKPQAWTASPGQLVMVAAPVVPFLLAALLLLLAGRLLL